MIEVSKQSKPWRPDSNSKSIPAELSDAVPALAEVAERVRTLEVEVDVAQREAFQADNALEAAPNQDRRAAANASGKPPAPTEAKCRQRVADAQRYLQAAHDRRTAAWNQQDQLVREHQDDLRGVLADQRKDNLAAIAAGLEAIEASIEQHEFDQRVADAIDQAPESGWQLSSPGPGYIDRQRVRAAEKLRGDLEFRSNEIGSAFELAAHLRWRLGLVGEQATEAKVPA